MEHDVAVRVELELFDLDASAKDALAVPRDLLEVSLVGVIDLGDVHPAIVRARASDFDGDDIGVHRLVMLL